MTRVYVCVSEMAETVLSAVIFYPELFVVACWGY